ncbi:fructosamine kinase family protein [Trueperella pecoris]|uniref:fructosamine kinase family protein n=1 Tax=Trueperella pecoris TaxID=2733571 RepID=UPI001ABDBB8C|nr:fructosamine kinase family protein [Trueperella pecoris]
MRKTYTKSADPRAIAHEVSGLEALSQAARHGGAPVARLATSQASSLETFTILQTTPSARAARIFGSRLAHTHAFAPAGERIFGEEPPTFAARFGHLGAMGSALLPMAAQGSQPRRFGEFYAEDRLLPYLKAAHANGSFGPADAEVIDRLTERLRDGHFDAPQPRLVHTDAALLHGDLWSGNVLWARADAVMDGGGASSYGSPAYPGLVGRGAADSEAVGVLIDPACHGGHAESDLAQLSVFAAPFVEEIYAGYQEASPLAEGWQERVGLHQLHMLIVHAALFGGSYGPQTIRVARRYL